MKVIFVGDKPSRLNHSRDVAFVGAPSYKRLIKWIKFLEVKDYKIYNSHDPIYINLIKQFSSWGYTKIVALGLMASKRLDDAGIEYYRLPHPSGLNRLNNNKEYINAKLTECREYIYES